MFGVDNLSVYIDSCSFIPIWHTVLDRSIQSRHFALQLLKSLKRYQICLWRESTFGGLASEREALMLREMSFSILGSLQQLPLGFLTESEKSMDPRGIQIFSIKKSVSLTL